MADAHDLLFNTIGGKSMVDDVLQLQNLRERDSPQFWKVCQVFEYIKTVDMPLLPYYLVDKPDVAFVIRFHKVVFHIKFNVVSEDEPEDMKTDRVEFSVQVFTPVPTSTTYEDYKIAVDALVVVLKDKAIISS